VRGPEHPPYPPGTNPLRRLRGRAVWREQGSVLKGHWAPWPWSRGARKARREARLLTALREAGSKVPALLGCERRAGWSCLRLEALSAAEPLDRWLADPRHSAAQRRRLLELWAQQLAGLMTLGLRQGDAHPGNWLIDPTPGIWAIDFERARLARRFRWRAVQAELARLGALLDGLCEPRERLRALDAWSAALSAEARAQMPDRPALHRLLAGQTERARRGEIERELDRWLRPSLRLQAAQGLTAWGPLPPQARLLRELAGSAAAGPGPRTAPFSATRLAAASAPPPRRAGLLSWLNGAANPRDCWSWSGAARAARQRWLAACREWEHGLPVAAPLGLDRPRVGQWRLLFDLPTDARARAPSALESARLDAWRARRGLKALRGAWSLFDPLETTANSALDTATSDAAWTAFPRTPDRWPWRYLPWSPAT
jgi:Lipopolysaccharide kinase (Kdo/WaaP) family